MSDCKCEDKSFADSLKEQLTKSEDGKVGAMFGPSVPQPFNTVVTVGLTGAGSYIGLQHHGISGALIGGAGGYVLSKVAPIPTSAIMGVILLLGRKS